MFFELIGTFLAGGAAALLFWSLKRWKPGLIAAWSIPVAAGVAMLAATISSEYGWFGRTSASLPDEFVVARSIEEKAIYRPWTYLIPMKSRFVAVDAASLRTNAALPEQRIVDLYFFGRWAPISIVPVAFDCGLRRSAPLTPQTVFAEDGSIPGADWRPVSEDSAVLETACALG